MKLFLISQNQNTNYDSYDSAVIAAPTKEIAQHMDPSTGKPITKKAWTQPYSAWCNSPEHVTVRYIGLPTVSIKQGVICASFNAG